MSQDDSSNWPAATASVLIMVEQEQEARRAQDRAQEVLQVVPQQTVHKEAKKVRRSFSLKTALRGRFRFNGFMLHFFVFSL